MCTRVVRVLPHCRLRARARGFEFPAREQQRSRLQLRVNIGRIQVGRARIGLVRVNRIVEPRVGAGAFVVGLRPVRPRLHGVPVLDRSLLDPAAGQVAVAPFDIRPGPRDGIARARDGRDGDGGGKSANAKSRSGLTHGSERDRYGCSAAANAARWSVVSSLSRAIGAISRTRPPSLRRRRAASSISEILATYSLAVTRPRP